MRRIWEIFISQFEFVALAVLAIVVLVIKAWTHFAR
jgi:hypothetical protein